VVVKRNGIPKQFERQLLKCINGNNNFKIPQRVEEEAMMLAARTLPIRVPATVHALHVYNLMQGENENEDGDNDADDGVVSDDAAAMQLIQNIEAVQPTCEKFTIIIRGNCNLVQS
jgi:hypothetical protein